MSTQPKESNSDEIQRILAENAYTRSLARTLWDTNIAVFNTVPIHLHPSYREEFYRSDKRYSQFEAACSLLYGTVKKMSPLLPLFPGVCISFVERELEIEMWSKSFSIVPEMQYISGIHTILIPNKSFLGERTLFHEFGHHIHTFFSNENNSFLLDNQDWRIEENGTQRPATLKDIAKQDSAEDYSIDHALHWKFYNKQGEQMGLYRHNNPLEMVAETFSDHYEHILQTIKDKPETTAKNSIDFILQHIEMI